MHIKGSLLILLTVSLGTALAMTAADQETLDGEVVGAVTKSHAQGERNTAVQQSSATHFDLSTIKRPLPKEVVSSGLFESRSWYAPPPPVAAAPVVQTVPVQPPQPTAPPLPFNFIGRMLDGSEVTLFISNAGNHYTVKVHDVVEDTYRVEKIAESEAVLTHLPTGTEQTLVFNTTQAANALISAADLKVVMQPRFSAH